MAKWIQNIFSSPFMWGVGSVIDLRGGHRYRPRRQMPQRPSYEEAMRKDWEAIGSDLRKAMEMEAEHQAHVK